MSDYRRDWKPEDFMFKGQKVMINPEKITKERAVEKFGSDTGYIISEGGSYESVINIMKNKYDMPHWNVKVLIEGEEYLFTLDSLFPINKFREIIDVPMEHKDTRPNRKMYSFFADEYDDNLTEQIIKYKNKIVRSVDMKRYDEERTRKMIRRAYEEMGKEIPLEFQE